MVRPRRHDDALRRRLLAEAGAIVGREGVAALSLRRVAAAVGTSTSAVYSLFGGKSELMMALFAEAFESFRSSQRAPGRTGDVASDLVAIGWAYWEWAMANPQLYPVIFGMTLAEYEVDRESIAASFASNEPLIEVVTAGVEGGELFGDPALIVSSLWASVHGVVSLVLAGCLPVGSDDQRAIYGATMERVLAAWSRPR